MQEKALPEQKIIQPLKKPLKSHSIQYKEMKKLKKAKTRHKTSEVGREIQYQRHGDLLLHGRGDGDEEAGGEEEGEEAPKGDADGNGSCHLGTPGGAISCVDPRWPASHGSQPAVPAPRPRRRWPICPRKAATLLLVGKLLRQPAICALPVLS